MAYMCLFSLFYRPKYRIKVHVWAGISCEGATKVCIFDGIMTKELYVGILDTTFKPFLRERLVNSHTFMQDNDPKHVAGYTQEYFRYVGINWWKTPPESPKPKPHQELVAQTQGVYVT